MNGPRFSRRLWAALWCYPPITSFNSAANTEAAPPSTARLTSQLSMICRVNMFPPSVGHPVLGVASQYTCAMRTPPSPRPVTCRFRAPLRSACCGSPGQRVSWERGCGIGLAFMDAIPRGYAGRVVRMSKGFRMIPTQWQTESRTASILLTYPTSHPVSTAITLIGATVASPGSHEGRRASTTPANRESVRGVCTTNHGGLRGSVRGRVTRRRIEYGSSPNEVLPPFGLEDHLAQCVWPGTGAHVMRMVRSAQECWVDWRILCGVCGG